MSSSDGLALQRNDYVGTVGQLRKPKLQQAAPQLWTKPAKLSLQEYCMYGSAVQWDWLVKHVNTTGCAVPASILIRIDIDYGCGRCSCVAKVLEHISYEAWQKWWNCLQRPDLVNMIRRCTQNWKVWPYRPQTVVPPHHALDQKKIFTRAINGALNHSQVHELKKQQEEAKKQAAQLAAKAERKRVAEATKVVPNKQVHFDAGVLRILDNMNARHKAACLAKAV